MKKLLAVLAVLLVLAAGAFAWLWWSALRTHHVLGGSASYAEHSALLRMPEGEAVGASFYGLGAHVPSVSTAAGWYAALSSAEKPEDRMTDEDFRMRYEAFREMLSGEACLALYADAENQPPSHFVLALRPKPASVLKAIYLSLRQITGSLGSKGEGSKIYELDKQTRLYYRQLHGGIFVSDQQALLDRAAAQAPRSLDAETLSSWEKIETAGNQDGGIGGFYYAKNPGGSAWGAMRFREDGLTSDWLVSMKDAGILGEAEAGALMPVPGSLYPEAAVEFWHNLSSEKKEGIPEAAFSDADFTKVFMDSLKAFYVLPPKEGEDPGFPSLVAGLLPAGTSERDVLAQNLDLGMSMAGMMAGQQMGGFFSPEAKPRKEGSFAGTELGLGFLSPCWLGNPRYILVASDCAALSPLIQSVDKPGEAAPQERVRLIVRGNALADSILALKGAEKLISPGADWQITPEDVEWLRRVREMRFTLNGAGADGLYPMRLEAAWNNAPAAAPAP